MITHLRTVAGVTYTLRGCTRGEVREAMALAGEREWEAEDFLVARCVLGAVDSSGQPVVPDWEQCLAGVVTTLMWHIREISGLSERSSERLREEAQEWIQTAAGHSDMLMMGLFGYKLEEIDAMDPPDWYRAAVAAETLYDMQNSQLAAASAPPPPGGRAPQAKLPDWQPHRKERVPEQSHMFLAR